MVELKPTPGILHISDILIGLNGILLIGAGLAAAAIGSSTTLSTPQGAVSVEPAIAALIPIVIGGVLLLIVAWDVGAIGGK